MDYNAESQGERDGTPRPTSGITQGRPLMALAYVGLVIAGLMLYGALVGRNAPATQQQPQFYYPDPTPFVVHNEYNFLSKNEVCFGVCSR